MEIKGQKESRMIGDAKEWERGMWKEICWKFMEMELEKVRNFLVSLFPQGLAFEKP